MSKIRSRRRSPPRRRDPDHRLRRAREALASERRVYRTILSCTPDLAYVFGLDHRFTYANEALLEMWGKSKEEALGKNCLELGYPPWHAAMHDRELDQVIASRKAVRGEVPFEGTHGRRIYDYIFVPVLDERGEVEAIAGTTRDVTEMRRRSTELEAAVAARTAELQDSVNELESFTYTVAHDLRAPLRAIHRYCELVLEGLPELPEETLRSDVRSAAAAAKKMDELIEDLLAYSRIGRAPAQLEPVDIGALARETVELLALQIRETGAHVSVTAETSLLARADRTLLEQVVVNLLTNALKFVVPGRTPKIEIGAARRDGRVRLWVQDNGLGIDPQYRERVFHLFERLHPRERYPGTGIGLAIVSKAVGRLGGKVDFESTPGEGSRFWVELPEA